MNVRLGFRRFGRGFTLIELLVVVLIVGILASVAMPQYFKVVERGKFTESMNYMNNLKGAQERYLARNGAYCSGAASSCAFDITLPALARFTVSALTASTNPSWTVTLTRSGTAPAGYGAYVVTYASDATLPGYTCNNASCTSDLIPQ